MTDLGANNHNFEDNFKKLTQQLESVYDSIKTKSDFDNVEVQKDQFMKLFCKAFDWNTEFEDEDDGLQFVHEKDEGNDAFVPVDDSDPSAPQEARNKNNSKKKNKKNKTKQQLLDAKDNSIFQDKSVAAKKKTEENDSSTAAPESYKIKQNTAAPDINGISLNLEMQEKLPTEQEEMLTPRGRLRLEHGSFSNTKRPSASYLAESGTNGIKSQDTTKDTEPSNGRYNGTGNEIDEEYSAGKGVPASSALGLSHNVSSEQSDSATSANTGKDEVKDNDKAEMANSVDTLPSLATLRNDWNTQHSNQSWASLSSRSSSSHDNDLMVNSYLTSQNGDLSNVMLPNIKNLGPRPGGTDMAFDPMTIQLHAVRQVLRNLILMLLAHHPNGVYDNDLQIEYERMTKTPLEMDDNIEYLLFNHRNVLITPCNQSNLLTLNHQAVQSILEEYSTQEISDVVSGHINTIIKLFPDGISANILDEMISNFRGYKLSQILSDPHQFVVNNCEVVAHTNEGSSIYFPASSAEIKSNLHNYSRVLSSAIGYRELLIALLANHKKPIGIEQLESEFRELFNMSLNACSPVINRILKKINDPALNQEQKQTQLEHASQVLNEANSFRSSLRSSLRSSYNSLKSMVSKFRLAANFELHYEKNRALFELFCPKGRQDTAVIKSPFKEDHRMVFMGGFAHGTSIKELEEALAKYGVKVIDCKGISYRNYGWSFVKVETPEQAEQLAAYSPIQIRGRNIDVRPFIDRKRVKNHQQNRPSANELLEAVLEAVHQTPSGLTVAQVQTNLFHKFQFRVDGTEITKLVSKHAKSLQIKRHPIERIVPTPKMHRLSMEELKSKILKIWTDSENSHDSDKKKDGGEKIKEQKILSLADFENEFARRYKAFLEPRLYGYHSVHELLQSMNDILCFPQVHLQSRVQQQQQPQQHHQQQGDMMIGSSPMPRVTETTPMNGGSIGNGNNSTMFNSRNATGATGRNTLLSNSGPAIGMDQMNSNPNMHTRSNMNAPRGVPMPTFSCMPTMQPNYQPIPLMGNSGLPFTMPQMQMYPGNIMPQMSDADMPNSLPTLENFWSLQSIPTEQQPFFLPSMSNVGVFSNRSLGSQSPGASKQNMKSAIGNPLSANLAQAPLTLFNQLSNGSQLMTPTKLG